MAYQVCTVCVMDNSDSRITFNQDGQCISCESFLKVIKPKWELDVKEDSKFQELIDSIKRKGKNSKYDCVIGLSGGLDSSYLLHVAVKNYGLRPLVFHVDGGWNTEAAVRNINSLITGLGLELITDVINWKEMRSLQLAFFRSGVPHIDLPQDHAFIASLYKFALQNNVKYILNGSNYSTEGIRNPVNWGWFGTDLKQIEDIHSKFGELKLKKYPLSGILNHKFYLKYIKGIKVVTPLNYVQYSKKEAEQTLYDAYGWLPYPQKHFESRFTKFYEGHWMPSRFGFDTRKPQFSSLIVTGQMSRDEAVARLNQPAYPMEDVEKDYDFIASKMRISVEELKKYHSMPLKTFKDYKNQEFLFTFGSRITRLLGIDKNAKKL
uniref:N-acetyl sugar amidotransferase n=1 Tax=Algoriphagus sp. TaxID=1872435 RepID=UPI0040473348